MKRAIRIFGILVVAITSLIAKGSAQVSESALGARTLVINEVYIGTTAQGTDQYVELYNSGTTTQYLDGMVLARFAGATSVVTSTGSTFQNVADAWIFPGRPGDTTLPIAPNTFVIIAASAARATGGQDLSGAAFETFAGRNAGDADNASSKNLRRLSKVTATGDFKMTAARDLVALFTGTDTSTANGINVSSFVDAVQFSTSTATSAVTSGIDAGVAGGSSLRVGMGLERKTVGVSTGNSSLDFGVFAPTPGSQHTGTGGGGGGGVVKGTDLLPLKLGWFNVYDTFVVDSNGVSDPTTKDMAASVVTAANLTFQGSTGVAVVSDTADLLSISGSVSKDLHFKGDANSDIQVFADQQFFTLFVPAELASGVTPPNKFVDFLKLSAGVNKNYPVMSISQTIDVPQSPIPPTLDLTATGAFKGIESITVPAGKFDSAYHFTITTKINVTVLISSIMNTTVVQDIWLVKNLGIVRSFFPAARGSLVPLPGAERRMTAAGLATLAVEPVLSKEIFLAVYPNPVSSVASISAPAGSRIISAVLHDVRGAEIQTLTPSDGSLHFNAASLSPGAYFARVAVLHDGRLTQQTLRITVTR